jgi:hypothetical protein
MTTSMGKMRKILIIKTKNRLEDYESKPLTMVGEQAVSMVGDMEVSVEMIRRVLQQLNMK